MASLRCFWLLFLAAGAIATDLEDSEDCGLNHCIPGSSAVVFAFRAHAHLLVLLHAGVCVCIYVSIYIYMHTYT